MQIEGGSASKEGALNLVVLETGALGLFLWVGLTISVILLVLKRLRFVEDVELRTYLVAVFAAFLAFTADGFAGPTLAVSPAGTFLWFAPGIAAYWLAGRGFTDQRSIAPVPRAAETSACASAVVFMRGVNVRALSSSTARRCV